jgi:hypothetical protein
MQRSRLRGHFQQEFLAIAGDAVLKRCAFQAYLGSSLVPFDAGHHNRIGQRGGLKLPTSGRTIFGGTNVGRRKYLTAGGETAPAVTFFCWTRHKHRSILVFYEKGQKRRKPLLVYATF